ncbi:1-acyl-sn-glycerol-3-phosphate acyltransferase [Bacillus sp. A301a_S52]|nr:1-acyl-sn-glycerol-3-phosphate acyltransferase [Bacillus sp. A301a_S52]
MLRTLIWYMYFFGYLVAVSPLLLKAHMLKKQGKKEELDAFIRTITSNWARRLIKLAGGKVSVIGAERIPKNEPLLIVSNHQGNFDIPVLLGYLGINMGFISKVEVKKIPLIRSWMILMGCIFMDRKDRRQAVKAIKQGAESFQHGQNLVIFPEGTRSKGGPVAPFKKGSFKLATKSGVTILPVTINGSYKLMEANNNLMTPGSVVITVTEPIRCHQTDETIDAQQLADLSRTQIMNALDDKQEHITTELSSPV